MTHNRTFKQAVRLRMTETGEKYTTAMRAIEKDPDELRRLKDKLEKMANRRRYPFTDKDGLDRRHVLSAFETQRRSH